MISGIEQARNRLGPSIPAMRKSLVDMAESLSTACLELERELSIDRLDQLVIRLKAVLDNLTHLRTAKMIDCETGHGTG
jgi:hypothetical protein